MNNAIDISLRHIHSVIPTPILKEALGDKIEYDLDVAIKEYIIDHVVITDCNIGGGKVVPIKLQSEWAEPLSDEAYSVYRIPSDVRGGRDIIEVQRVQHDPKVAARYYGHVGFGELERSQNANLSAHMSSFPVAQQSMLESKTGIGGVYNTPKVELLQGDLIRLNPDPRMYIAWILTCRLAYDTDMTNLNAESINDFADACVLAAKRYCYVNLSLKLDAGKIMFGGEIASFKTHLDEWRDLTEQYEDKIKKFMKSNSLDINRVAVMARYGM